MNSSSIHLNIIIKLIKLFSILFNENKVLNIKLLFVLNSGEELFFYFIKSIFISFINFILLSNIKYIDEYSIFFFLIYYYIQFYIFYNHHFLIKYI